MVILEISINNGNVRIPMRAFQSINIPSQHSFANICHFILRDFMQRALDLVSTGEALNQ